MVDRHFVFTMTTGRSGTAYLAELLGRNLPDSESIHEALAFDQFGVDRPDLSHMTLFNSVGNVDKVRDFWNQKLARIAGGKHRFYIETSHILMKAGLIENLAPLLRVGRVHLIVLERDPIATIKSFRARYDFIDKANQWFWYLDPTYPLNLSDSKKLAAYGINGVCLWYITEVRLRTAYYEKLLAGQSNIRIHRVTLDDLQQPAKVAHLLGALGAAKGPDEIAMPPAQNVGTEIMEWAPGEEAKLARLVAAAQFDAPTLAQMAIKQGKGFQPNSLGNAFYGITPRS